MAFLIFSFSIVLCYIAVVPIEVFGHMFSMTLRISHSNASAVIDPSFLRFGVIGALKIQREGRWYLIVDYVGGSLAFGVGYEMR